MCSVLYYSEILESLRDCNRVKMTNLIHGMKQTMKHFEIFFVESKINLTNITAIFSIFGLHRNCSLFRPLQTAGNDTYRFLKYIIDETKLVYSAKFSQKSGVRVFIIFRFVWLHLG